MKQHDDVMPNRQAGAEAIARMARVIGINKGTLLSECVWELGEDHAHEYAHRLELSTENKSVRLYFSDAELTGSGNAARQKRTEARLSSAIAQLCSRTPAQTYSFQ